MYTLDILNNRDRPIMPGAQKSQLYVTEIASEMEVSDFRKGYPTGIPRVAIFGPKPKPRSSRY